MNQLKKKKVLEKSTDNGIIDKLFNQYYDTIKEVLAEDSVERINANTQNALDEVEKKKGVGFMNYIMEQISKDGKNNTGVKRSQNLLNNTQNMDKLNSSKN